MAPYGPTMRNLRPQRAHCPLMGHTWSSGGPCQPHSKHTVPLPPLSLCSGCFPALKHILWYFHPSSDSQLEERASPPFSLLNSQSSFFGFFGFVFYVPLSPASLVGAGWQVTCTWALDAGQIWVQILPASLTSCVTLSTSFDLSLKTFSDL